MIRYEAVHNGNTTKVFAFDGENAVGFGEILCVLETADIIDIEVSADYRRQGIGREILNRLLDNAYLSGVKTITLEVRVSNVAARTLYENMKFIEISQRKRYYDDGEDAVIMQIKCLQCQ